MSCRLERCRTKSAFRRRRRHGGAKRLSFEPLEDRLCLSELLNVPLVPNQPPVANSDSYTIAEDNSLNVLAASGVLANDTDADGDTLAAVLVLAPPPAAFGLLQLQPDGSFSFAPSPNFNGTVSFTYLARDSKGADSPPAVVTISVTPVIDPPVAGNDLYQAVANTPLVVATPGVLANDFDVDSPGVLGSLTAVLASGTADGSLMLNSNGSFTYIPNPGYAGPDSFAYTVRDNAGDVSNQALVTLNIVPNQPPVAVDDSSNVQENSAALVFVVGNDFDPDG